MTVIGLIGGRRAKPEIAGPPDPVSSRSGRRFRQAGSPARGGVFSTIHHQLIINFPSPLPDASIISPVILDNDRFLT